MKTNLSETAPQRPLLGRNENLNALVSWVLGPAASCALVGAPGIGKTALLRAFGARCVDTYAAHFDEVWWCDMTGIVSMAGLVAKVALVTSVPLNLEDDFEALAAELAAALAERGRILLLLDSTEGISDRSRDGLPALAFNPTMLKWVLSTHLTTGVAETRLFIKPLALVAAVAMLERSAQRADAGVLNGDPAELAELAERLDRIPLALEVGGRWLATLTPSQMLAILAERNGFLREDDERAGLDAALATTWASASPEDRDAVGALCAIDGDFSLEAAGGVWAMRLDLAARQLRRLQWLSFVWLSRDGRSRRFSLYASVRAFVALRSDARHSAAARERHIQWLVEVLPGRSHEARWAERANVEAALAWALGVQPALAAELVLAAFMVPQDDAMRASLLGRLKIVLASVATSATPDPELLARLHHRIGQLHTLPGRIAQALESFEQAHDLAESADSARTQAAVDADLALAYLLTGRAERALTLAQTAAEAARHSGDVGTRLRALAVVARIETHALHIDDASAIICDARMTAERHGDPEAQQAAFRMAHAFAALAGRLDLIENVEPAALDVVCCLARAEALRASGDLQGARASYRAVLTQESAASNAQLLRRRDVGVAMLDVLREAPERVVDILASRVADDESNGRYLGAIYGRLIWGTGLALAGEHRAGWEQLQQGLRDAREHRLWVVLADFAPVAATVAWAAGGAQEAAELLSRWDGPSRAETLPWHVALAQLARAVVVGQTLPESGAQERWTMLAIRRLAETASRATSGVVPAQAAPIATMEIGPKWRWFRVDGGDAVELIRRNAGRRMLQHLVGAWATDPGEAIARDRLIQVGWPGEKMSVESAAARVHTTLWRLRKLGLADVLVTTADGYRLRTDLRIVEHERADGGSY